MPLSEDDPRSVGEYVLVDRLGSGGMGVVYLGRSRSGRDVAVKVVHGQYAHDEVFRTRFRQEIDAVRKVSGVFTAPVVDADPAAVRPWMATQYVPGPSLADRVRKDGPLGAAELRRLALGLVEALRDIHRAGVVHRDLKPANVLIAQDGPRVIDFGISRTAENLTLTQTGHMIGTPPFMSPEQLRDSRSVVPASDVFSLGALLVYAATGRGPFDAESPYMAAYRVMNEEPDLAGVAEPLRGIVARCLAKEQGERPELGELAREFQALSAGESVVASRATGPAASEMPRASGGGRLRSRVSLAVTIGAVALGALGLTAYLVLGERDSDWAKNGTGAGHLTPASPSASPRWGPPPSGWRPWLTTVNAPAAVGPDQTVTTVDGGEETYCVLSDGAVYCGGTGVLPMRVDAATGAIAWRATSTRTVARYALYRTKVLGVRDGLVLVVETLGGESGDEKHTLLALDPDSGGRRWSQPLGAGYGGGILSGDLVLTASTDGRVVTARSARSGAVRWTRPLPERNVCRFTDSDRGVYLLCQELEDLSGRVSVLTLDLTDGSAHRSETQFDSAWDGVDGTYDGRLVFVQRHGDGTGSDFEDQIYTRVVLVDPETGSRSATNIAEEVRGWPTLLDGRLYFVRSNGEVTAVSLQTGMQLWRTQTTLENAGRPVLDKGGHTVYLASTSGRVVAIDERTGDNLWESASRTDPSTAGDPFPQVLLNQGALIVVTLDGTLFTLDPSHPDRTSATAASES
ncbi:hypothetical protein ACM01_33880 [Streptomyces viridochromogenes]|uniref:Protein kinase domain-containing protein n=1 Tax=Streptomyces viridochromogenes TaxID=1938 RepID=A0A0J7Z362_STRVR|nr:serine/threonine-protein kinase [Streptomyces viridochromogenes]KMS69693.1 hypothetical protein ACM01_33880 [Streptomyces viridochromogenes]